MTEEQIEAKAERAMDILDRQWIASRTMTELEYRAKCAEIDCWAKRQYALAQR